MTTDSMKEKETLLEVDCDDEVVFLIKCIHGMLMQGSVSFKGLFLSKQKLEGVEQGNDEQERLVKKLN
jgi:hypothetical protein